RRHRIVRVGEVDGRIPAGDGRRVRRIEHVDAQLEGAGPAQPDVPRDRQIEHADEAALEIAVARLEADAPWQRSLERYRVELPVGIAAAAAARIADDADPCDVVG